MLAEFRSTRFACAVVAGFALVLLVLLAVCAFPCVNNMLAARATGRQSIRIHRLALIIGGSPFARGWLADRSPRRAGSASARQRFLSRESCDAVHPRLLLLRRLLLGGHCRFRRLKADLRMRSITERLLRRRPTAAQRHCRLAFQIDLRAIYIVQPDRPLHAQRSVGSCRDR